MATKDSDHRPPCVVPLDSTNYAQWKYSMKWVLVYDKLWAFVQIPVPAVGAIPKDWDENNDAAMSRMMLAIGPDQHLHVNQLVNAHDVWETLRRIHEWSTVGTKMFLR